MFQFLRFLAWSTKIHYRHKTGRLFIFRDAPDWYCAQVAALEETPGATDLTKELAQLALEELRTRLHRIKSEIRRLSAQGEME
jgi:hypothetical protein